MLRHIYNWRRLLHLWHGLSHVLAQLWWLAHRLRWWQWLLWLKLVRLQVLPLLLLLLHAKLVLLHSELIWLLLISLHAELILLPSREISSHHVPSRHALTAAIVLEPTTV